MVEGFMRVELREQKEKLQALAKKNGMSSSSFLRKIIEGLNEDATLALNQPVLGKRRE